MDIHLMNCMVKAAVNDKILFRVQTVKSTAKHINLEACLYTAVMLKIAPT
jgi:hypothetical protein